MGDRPVDRILDIDSTDVVAVECLVRVRLVIGELFGAIIVEQAVADDAASRAFVALSLRHGRRLDASLPNVVNHAIVNRGSFGPVVRVDLDAVPFDVLNGDVGDGDSRCSRNSDEFTVPTVRSVKDDLVAITGLAAQRDLIGREVEVTRQHVMAIGDKNRATRLDLFGRSQQFVDGPDSQNLATGFRQCLSLGKPRGLRWCSL